MMNLPHVLQVLHIAAAGVLVGKVLLLSFVVAPILAKQLEPESFARVVRRLFPAYYAMGMVTASVGLLALALLAWSQGLSPSLWVGGTLWGIIFWVEAYCRSPLSPRSNDMRDRLKAQASRGQVDPELQAVWDRLHRWSIYLNSVVLCGGIAVLGCAIALLSSS